MLNYIVVSFLILSLSVNLFASDLCLQFLDANYEKLKHEALNYENAKFLIPNETQPERSTPILDNAKDGIIVGVGSERVIFDFLLKKSRTPYVVAVDSDPGIVQFHHMNSLLLRITPPGDILTYQKLRLDDDFSFWKKVVHEAKKQKWIDIYEFQYLTNKKNMAWWFIKVAKNSKLNWMRRSQNDISRFGAVNYIFDVSLFEKIQNLAKAKRYLTQAVDLSDKKSVDELRNLLRKLTSKISSQSQEITQEKISILNLSNAWEHYRPNFYLGVQGMTNLLFWLQDNFVREVIILTTAEVQGDINILEPYERNWLYAGFQTYTTNASLRTLDSWNKKATQFERYISRRQVEISGMSPLQLSRLSWSDLIYF